MGFIRKKVKKSVPCGHIGSFGDYCKKCGARKKMEPGGFDSPVPSFGIGFVEQEEEIVELCNHLGELGEFCSKCGDRLKLS